MKTPKLFILLSLLAFLICNNSVQAQSFQYELSASINNAPILCGKVVSGHWAYHITYHLNKEGELTKLHWNLNECELRDVVTMEKYRVLDTGNDDLGALWDLFNCVNAFNAGYDVIYDQPDGWLDAYLPAEYPTEGRLMSMNFKVVGKGGVIGYWKTLVQIHVNANGELTSYVVKDQSECF